MNRLRRSLAAAFAMASVYQLGRALLIAGNGPGSETIAGHGTLMLIAAFLAAWLYLGYWRER